MRTSHHCHSGSVARSPGTARGIGFRKPSGSFSKGHPGEGGLRSDGRWGEKKDYTGDKTGNTKDGKRRGSVMRRPKKKAKCSTFIELLPHCWFQRGTIRGSLFWGLPANEFERKRRLGSSGIKRSVMSEGEAQKRRQRYTH